MKAEEFLKEKYKKGGCYPWSQFDYSEMVANMEEYAQEQLKNCNLQNVNASNSEITWALLENKDFENSFAMERLGINKNTIISIESDPEGDADYKMVYYWR